jgi:hypothetical protein
MSAKSHHNLKTIRFGGELLPNWTQLLDIAARLCPVSEEVRHWFSRFTSASGTDDSQTVIEFCTALRASLRENQDFLLTDLRRGEADDQPRQILAGWFYALDTMILEAQTRETCAWMVEGTENLIADDSDDGDITLRRV